MDSNMTTHSRFGVQGSRFEVFPLVLVLLLIMALGCQAEPTTHPAVPRPIGLNNPMAPYDAIVANTNGLQVAYTVLFNGTNWYVAAASLVSYPLTNPSNYVSLAAFSLQSTNFGDAAANQ